MSAIEQRYNKVEAMIFNVESCGGSDDYSAIIAGLVELADLLAESPTDENTWYIGEFNLCPLGELIVGAYWHLTEWHGGQSSQTYAALCSLGQIFNPGMSSVEEENEAYIALGEIAERWNHADRV